MRNKLKNYFHQLAKLQKIILACYFQKDYRENQFEYEKKIHNQSRAVLKLLSKIVLTDQAGYLYEIIISLGNLRFRVTDFATFEICAEELEAISLALATVFNKLTGMSELSASIEAFEEVYRGALQVAATDPLAFLFFIQDLYTLRDKLNEKII